MKIALTALMAAVLVTCTLVGFNYAQEVEEAKRADEEHAVPPSGSFEESFGEYEYVITSVLYEEQEKYMGKYIKFVDELAVLWDNPTEHDSEEEEEQMRKKRQKDDYDNQTLQKSYGYVKFETCYHRCLIPQEYDDSVSYLRDLNAHKNYTDSEDRFPKPKLIYVYGKLIRSTAWGKVERRGAEMGTEPEHVVVMVHKIEEAPERFFKEAPNEEDQ